MHVVPSLLHTALSFPLFLLLIVVTTILASLFRVVSIFLSNAPCAMNDLTFLFRERRLPTIARAAPPCWPGAGLVLRYKSRRA